MFADSLRAIIAQTLLPRIGGGRVAAREILFNTAPIANLIREGKTFQIPAIMQTSRRHGMTTLNDALLELVESGTVAPEEAYLHSFDKNGLATAFRGRGIDVSYVEAEPRSGQEELFDQENARRPWALGKLSNRCVPHERLSRRTVTSARGTH